MSGFEEIPYIIHGGDYNPDQWKDYKEVVEKDIKEMKVAGINCATVGIFSWARIEKTEGHYEFEWLDYIVKRFEENGLKIILATPSAAMPAWMAKKYPEVLRTGWNKVRNEWGERVNYCPSSLIYREKCKSMDEQLAKRYGNHPVVVMWHINNEIAGACYCKSCEQRFRHWLQEKYETLDNLNQQWWTGFWSHTYYDWEEVGFPGLINGKLDNSCKGQLLDTKRFFSYIMADQYKVEYDIIRQYSKTIPITTNTWRMFGEMNYRDFEPYMDYAAFDFYPQYNDQPGDEKLASAYGFALDYYRGMKEGKPYVIMETAPGSPLIHAVKLRRPGIQKLIAAQAMAHGANSINYFQWRKGRGGCEQYHGAVMDHCDRMDTKTFCDIKEVSKFLTSIPEIKNQRKAAEVAVIYDVESDWAIGEMQAVHPDKKYYKAECVSHYRAFYEMGMNVDVIDPKADFSPYKLVIAPMLYLVTEEKAIKIKEFVRNGGCFVTGFLTGWTNENVLSHTTGFPGLLREVTGIWVEETDVLNDGEHLLKAWVEEVPQVRKPGVVSVKMTTNKLQLTGTYKARTMCDQIHAEDAKVVAVYDGEYYKGNPCMTVNTYGSGEAYYLGTRMGDDFLHDFYTALADQLEITSILNTTLPRGVVVTKRNETIFIMNFTNEEKLVILEEQYIEYGTNKKLEDMIPVSPYGVVVMKPVQF